MKLTFKKAQTDGTAEQLLDLQAKQQATTTIAEAISEVWLLE
jgi:hypothetical protein